MTPRILTLCDAYLLVKRSLYLWRRAVRIYSGQFSLSNWKSAAHNFSSSTASVKRWEYCPLYIGATLIFIYRGVTRNVVSFRNTENDIPEECRKLAWSKIPQMVSDEFVYGTWFEANALNRNSDIRSTISFYFSPASLKSGFLLETDQSDRVFNVALIYGGIWYRQECVQTLPLYIVDRLIYAVPYFHWGLFCSTFIGGSSDPTISSGITLEALYI